MGRHYDELEKEHITFIRQQKLSFVGTAANDSTVNVSPKGWDKLRALSSNRIAWLNITGNETATHLTQNERRTMKTSETISMRNARSM